MRNGLAYLIDFQGMRPGLAEYDLASLLFDPYVDLAANERAELMAYYQEEQAKNGRPNDTDFETIFRFCAMQRLMQALGAYGFLGLAKHHEGFLQYIPSALASLRSIVSGIGELEPLAAVLAELN
jgi:aminoglycoside/choline kinase family phosphotransferase